MGLSALVYPLFVKRQLFKLDVPVMIVATVMFLAFLYDGRLTLIESILFLLAIAIYLGFMLYYARKDGDSDVAADDVKLLKHWTLDLLLIAVGLIGLVLGSDLLVENSIFVANAWGMSEAMIGLTIVAAGTSMPELATSIVAAMKKNSDIAIGNVVGSSIFNILLIMGVAGAIKPIHAEGINIVDGLFLWGITLLLYQFMKMRRSINGVQGACLMAVYFAYFAYKLLSM